MKKLFGTDGIRGPAGTFPLDEPSVRAIGRSLTVQYQMQLGRRPRFVTGRDTRESGGWIEAAFHSGAVLAGAECVSAGVITTPGVAFVTRNFEFVESLGMSVSRNTYGDDGIKFDTAERKKIGESTEQALERVIYAAASENGKPRQEAVDDSRADEFQRAYIDHLIGGFND